MFAVACCDDETATHLLRIGAYVRFLATELGLPEDTVGSFETASALHDVGKIGIPRAILRKNGPLDPAERAVVQTHTTIGEQLLIDSPSPLINLAREIAISHHENWDGSGYPGGLAGEQIPLAGRIVKLADQYDALRSQRPYKPAYSHSKACEVVLDGDLRTDPVHFDPDLLSIFRRQHRVFDRIWNDVGT